MMTRNALNRAIQHEGGVSRRLWLAYVGALTSLPLVNQATRAESRVSFANNPFSLGVASGDPDHQSVVLWTRLAPEPLEPDGGLPPVAYEVQWELATEESMQNIVSQGTALATPQLGHSVHVVVSRLLPDRWYWYRFRVGDAESVIGRTRTLPSPDALVPRLKFAVTSCQNYEQGLYTAYEQMARDELDLVFHLGDYIYEYKGRDNLVRKHLGNEIESLTDYRLRYAQYKLDPLLQHMHAVCPWFVTWDDHEVDNNYANDISEELHVDPADFLLRRANAYQAYYEMMPLRPQSLPQGPDLQLYRRASFGRLAEFLVLDTRQYRTDQPNNDKRSPLNDAALDRNNSLLGTPQRNWLYQSLLRSQGTWNILAQQVMMGMVGFSARNETEPVYSMDQWPSAAAERMQLMRFLSERRVPNPVVLTGDIHSHWANELRVDDRKPEDPIVATELVGTSLSSGGNGPQTVAGLDDLLAANPCVRYHSRQRGYIRCTVTPSSWVSDYMITSDVVQPGGSTAVDISWAIENGNPQLQRA